jgi:outer membrane protein OmpA-like peptidoglycan-associated protein
LVKNGIAKIRIRVDGKGSSDNIGNIAHPKGYNLNNRIEYIITPTPINKN